MVLFSVYFLLEKVVVVKVAFFYYERATTLLKWKMKETMQM